MALILKKDAAPTMFNQEMLIGGGLGGWIGIAMGLAASIVLPVPGLIGLGNIAGTLIGGYMGGSQGYERIEKERTEGKTLEEPTRWNKKALAGFFVGSELASLVGAASVLAGAAAGSGLGALAGGETGLLVGAGTGVLAGLGVGIATPFIGAYIGGGMGKREMEQDLAKAEGLMAHHHALQLAESQGVSVSHSHEPEVTTSKHQDAVKARRTQLELVHQR